MNFIYLSRLDNWAGSAVSKDSLSVANFFAFNCFLFGFSICIKPATPFFFYNKSKIFHDLHLPYKGVIQIFNKSKYIYIIISILKTRRLAEKIKITKLTSSESSSDSLPLSDSSSLLLLSPFVAGFSSSLDDSSSSPLLLFFHLLSCSSRFLCSSSSSGFVNLRLLPLWLVHFPGEIKKKKTNTHTHALFLETGTKEKRMSDNRTTDVTTHTSGHFENRCLSTADQKIWQ